MVYPEPGLTASALERHCKEYGLAIPALLDADHKYVDRTQVRVTPEAAVFERGEEIRPSYAIRSGENGFFTVADADSLYRVMRVASASELGLMLSSVGVLGEDRLSPWFRDNVCYYHETDSARQVLDFLSQPSLFGTQLSGLEPMSLQDLGSAKHQAEMHTLALFILLHRLRTLDVDAIDPYVDLERFDAKSFFEQHSRTLTFEELAGWDFEHLAEDMRVLASADAPQDLVSLTAAREYGLFPGRKRALDRVLDRVLRAVWAVPSLGSPLIFERQGVPHVRTGYYVAPLDLLVTDGAAVASHLREAHRTSGNPCSFEEYRDYHLSVSGFVDLRPHAIVCTAKSDEEDLRGRVATFRDEDGLRRHLRAIDHDGGSALTASDRQITRPSCWRRIVYRRPSTRSSSGLANSENVQPASALIVILFFSANADNPGLLKSARA